MINDKLDILVKNKVIKDYFHNQYGYDNISETLQITFNDDTVLTILSANGNNCSWLDIG